MVTRSRSGVSGTPIGVAPNNIVVSLYLEPTAGTLSEHEFHIRKQETYQRLSLLWSRLYKRQDNESATVLFEAASSAESLPL